MHLTNYAVNRSNRSGGPTDPKLSTRLPHVKSAEGGSESDEEAASLGSGGGGGSEDDGVTPPDFRAYDANLTPDDPVLYGMNGVKWSLSAFFQVLEADGVDIQKLWSRICDLVSKTILSVSPVTAHLYRSSRVGNRVSEANPSEEEQGARTCGRAACMCHARGVSPQAFSALSCLDLMYCLTMS